MEAFMMKVRAAFYARVSGEQQAAAHTIESQIAALNERAQNDGTCSARATVRR
jgi:DNA invertase Pin-like site-specific DNA recombinase